MNVIDTAGLRRLVTRATLMAKTSIAFTLRDVTAICDELEMGRLATKTAGDLLVEARSLVEQLSDGELLLAERKRLRKEADEWRAKVTEILGETDEQIRQRTTDAAIEPASDTPKIDDEPAFPGEGIVQ